VNGKVSVYLKAKFGSISDFFNNYGRTLVAIYKGKKSFEVEGYDKLDWMDLFRMETKYVPEPIEISGMSFDKIELLKDPVNNSKLATIDQFFKSVSVDSAKQVKVEVENKKAALEEAGLVVSEEYEECHKELVTLLEKAAGREDKTDRTPVRIEDYFDRLTDMVKDMEMLGPEIKREQFQQRDFNFDNPASLMQNPRLLGEFNALFPGMWEKYERNELFLTRSSLRSKIKNAKATLTLKKSNKSEFEKYVKLYIITLAVLNSVQICQHFQHQSHDLSQAIDDLWNDEEVEGGIEDIGLYMAPPRGGFQLDIDLNRLF